MYFCIEILKYKVMQYTKLKQFMLLLAIFLPTAWCGANTTNIVDGVSHINIKESSVQDVPRGSSILASINGHYLMVTFTENLGQVVVEVTTASGGAVECLSITTPNGLQIYIPNTGDYIVTFTLPNGDEYYGEFTVTN
jgi:hypothetical protein